MSRYKDLDPFDTPHDVAYVQARIDALTATSRAQWVDVVDQIAKCANPPHGMRVTDEAKALAKAKMKELGARNRRQGSR